MTWSWDHSSDFNRPRPLRRVRRSKHSELSRNASSEYNFRHETVNAPPPLSVAMPEEGSRVDMPGGAEERGSPQGHLSAETSRSDAGRSRYEEERAALRAAAADRRANALSPPEAQSASQSDRSSHADRTSNPDRSSRGAPAEACLSASPRLGEASGATPGANGELSASLVQAAGKGLVEELTDIIANGANVNQRDDQGDTALRHACAKGNFECVRVLLAAGASVHLTNIDGTPPLTVAACWGRTECARLLLAAGASVNAIDSEGCTSLHHAAIMGHGGCVRLLLESHADPTIASNGQIPQVWARTVGHAHIVELFDPESTALSAAQPVAPPAALPAAQPVAPPAALPAAQPASQPDHSGVVAPEQRARAGHRQTHSRQGHPFGKLQRLFRREKGSRSYGSQSNPPSEPESDGSRA